MKYSATRERNWIVGLIGATVAIAMGALVVMKTIHDRNYMQVEIASSSQIDGGFGTGGAGGIWNVAHSEITEEELRNDSETVAEEPEIEDTENDTEDTTGVDAAEPVVAEAEDTSGDTADVSAYEGYGYAPGAYAYASEAAAEAAVSQPAVSSVQPMPQTPTAPAADSDTKTPDGTPDNPGVVTPAGDAEDPNPPGTGKDGDIPLVHYYTILYRNHFTEPGVNLYIYAYNKETEAEGDLLESGAKVEEGSLVVVVAEKPTGKEMLLRGAAVDDGTVKFEYNLSTNTIRVKTRQPVDCDIEYTFTYTEDKAEDPPITSDTDTPGADIPDADTPDPVASDPVASDPVAADPTGSDPVASDSDAPDPMLDNSGDIPAE